MDLHLQVGWGMMKHCCTLIEKWGGGTAVLSPRDLECDQIERFAKQIKKLKGGRVWFDPQFYVPHADHERLCSHPYWPQNFQTNLFWQGPALKKLMAKLVKVNASLGADLFLLPGILGKQIDDDWFATQEAFLSHANSLKLGIPAAMTIALSDKAVMSDDQIESLLERAANWNIDTFYVVCQHPNGNYLVAEDNWLANVLDLVAGLKMLKKKVFIAYASHQMLISACAKADGLVSGTWLNVRSFPPDKFIIPEDDDPKQRSTWYYCPQSLSEYKIPSLDLAKKAGVLGKMKAPKEWNGGYADSLFTGIQPSAASFAEPEAFRHYLHSLRAQCIASSSATFDEALAFQGKLLTGASNLMKELRKVGVRGANRDFSGLVEPNENALASLVASRGPVLKRKWSKL